MTTVRTQDWAMLASPSTSQGGRRQRTIASLEGNHAFEPKIDGVRARVAWSRGQHAVAIHNRNGVEMTDIFPEIHEAFVALNPPSMTLDGEIVLTGNEPFGNLMRRVKANPAKAAQLRGHWPAHFVAFDVLWYGPTVQEANPYATRRELLEAVVPPLHDASPPDGGVVLIPQTMAGQELYAVIRDSGGEGVVAKRLTSIYRSGVRSPDWVKFKATRQITCVAVSYEPGKGARKHFGAIHVALIDPTATAPTYVGRVGSGFSAEDIAEVKAALDRHEFPLVEIETLGRTPDNKLRFPVFKHVRRDVGLESAHVRQLDELSLQ